MGYLIVSLLFSVPSRQYALLKFHCTASRRYRQGTVFQDIEEYTTTVRKQGQICQSKSTNVWESSAEILILSACDVTSRPAVAMHQTSAPFRILNNLNTEMYIVLLVVPFCPSLKRDMFCFQDRSWRRYQWRQQNRDCRGGGQRGQRWCRCRLRRSSRSANQVRVQRHENSNQGSDSVHRLRRQSWRWDPNFPFPYMHYFATSLCGRVTRLQTKKPCWKAKKIRQKFCNHPFA